MQKEEKVKCMAYVSKEDKAIIKTQLEKVIPKGWKWSLSIKDSMKINLTIWAAPFKTENTENFARYYVRKITDVDTKTLMQKIVSSMRTPDFKDDTDIHSDYLNYSYYYDVRFGTWKKPFKSTGETFNLV